MMDFAWCIRHLGATFAFFALLSPTCNSAQIPPTWKVECVGRFQIGLPQEVEVAVAKADSFPQFSRISPYAYSDGRTASYSKVHFEGLVFVSDEVTKNDVQKIVRRNQKSIDEAKKKYLAEGDKESANSLQPISLPVPESYAWKVDNAIDLYIHRTNRLFTWEASNNDTFQHNRGVMLKILNGFRTRQPFETPQGTGICIPYGFIPDGGSSWRDVGVSFRLKDHPDVEIFFRDEGTREDPSRLVNRSTREELQFFWEHNYRGAMKEVHLSWPHYRSVKLDGRDGEYTFARFTRTDGTPDFGYLAYVKGDAKAPNDTPSLMLYVIRTGSRAKGSPVSEDELKDIAKKIAASIRRRT
jgi:hypothetical protein